MGRGMDDGQDQHVAVSPVELLTGARRIVAERIAPRAQAVDQAPMPPVENLRALADAGLLGLPVPVEYGGLGAAPHVVREFMELLASACGVTTFVVFQHFGVCGHLTRCANEPLKREVLPDLATGRRLATLAFSHLRRPGPPAVRVEECPEGFRFNGVAPWATGWGIADDLLLAGTLPDGHFLWVLTPARESDHLAASPPMRLCAATASATVSLELRDLVVPVERHVKTIGREELERDTVTGMLTHAMLSLGVTRAAAALLRSRGERRVQARMTAAAAALESQADRLRTEVHAWGERASDPGYVPGVLRARAACIELGVRAAQAAVVASGGGANLTDHPAQRLYREAMLYSVTALTGELQELVLAALTAGQSE
jgi:alkylation response protein AidB-like acyl-CoA dehydrogenase